MILNMLQESLIGVRPAFIPERPVVSGLVSAYADRFIIVLHKNPTCTAPVRYRELSRNEDRV